MYQVLKSKLKKRVTSKFAIMSVIISLASGCTVVETYTRFSDTRVFPIFVHVFGVLLSRFLHNENLISSMWSGCEQFRSEEHSHVTK